MNKQELAALLEQELIKQREAEESQRAQRKAALEAQLQTAASSAPDVSGLGTAVDAIYGTQIGAPMLMQQKRQDEQLARLDEMLMKQEPTGQNYAAQLAKLYDDEQQQGKDQRQMLGLQTSAFRDVKNELQKFQKEAEPVIKTFDLADKALSSLDRAQVTSVLSLIARNIGENKGALAEGDIDRTWLETYPTLVKKFADRLGGKGTAKLDPQEVQELVALVNNARATMGPAFKNRYQGLAETYQGNPIYAQAFAQARGADKTIKKLLEGSEKSKIDFTKAAESPLAGLPGSGVAAPAAPGALSPRAMEMLKSIRGKQ